jgi:hypothetical protein
MDIDVVGQTARIHVEHSVFIEFITSCTEMFDKSGAVNYLELKFFSAIDMRTYEVTIKPSSGIAPGDINSRLRYALEKIKAGTDDPAAVASLALSNCGYIDPMTPEAVAYLRNYFPFVGGQGLD